MNRFARTRPLTLAADVDARLVPVVAPALPPNLELDERAQLAVTLAADYIEFLERLLDGLATEPAVLQARLGRRRPDLLAILCQMLGCDPRCVS